MHLLLLSEFGSCPPHKLLLFEGWRLWLLGTKTIAWFGVTLCGTIHGSPVSRVHKTKPAPQTKCFRNSLAISLTFICQSYLLKKKDLTKLNILLNHILRFTLFSSHYGQDASSSLYRNIGAQKSNCSHGTESLMKPVTSSKGKCYYTVGELETD